MANPCRTHTDFHGDLCPVCLMEERDRLLRELEHQQQLNALYRADREKLIGVLCQLASKAEDALFGVAHFDTSTGIAP